MEQLKKALALLSECYDYFPESRASIYFGFLKDLPEEAVCKAIGELIRTEEKCPSIAKIRNTAEELIAVASGNQIAGAGEGWKRYLDACKRVNYFKRIVHFPDDPILEQTASYFSVDEILMMPPEKMAIVRKQFIDRYKEVEAFTKKNDGYKAIVQRFPQIGNIGKVKVISGGRK